MANRLTDKTVAHPGPLRPQGRRGRTGGPAEQTPGGLPGVKDERDRAGAPQGA